MYTPKILIYDIETAGVNALNADLGFVITFGYIWLSDFEKGKKWKTISIGDFSSSFKKDPHNDKALLQAAAEIINQADGIIGHYANRFDKPFLATRALLHGVELADVPQLDTCYLAYKKLKLSSNRLVNIAKVFKCKWQKLDKKDGWPLWWNHYLKGSLKYDKAMRKYCGYDVMTLAEISVKMKPYWPPSFTNRLYPKTIEKGCSVCGSSKLHHRGQIVYRREIHNRLACQDCGSWANYEKI